ncbi:MAG TPA: hypothetical protein VMV69_10280 [Pirellulales bacterium]|nr:hypothetical protein [Pirellulales bacterium]
MNTTPTSSAYTAGPWTLEEEITDFHEIRLELKGDAGSKPIAEIYLSFAPAASFYDTLEEYEADLAEYAANARLIVAAPDMLTKLYEYSSDCQTRIDILRDEMKDLDLTEEDEDARDLMDQIGHWDATKRGVDALIANAEGR